MTEVDLCVNDFLSSDETGCPPQPSLCFTWFHDTCDTERSDFFLKCGLRATNHSVYAICFFDACFFPVNAKPSRDSRCQRSEYPTDLLMLKQLPGDVLSADFGFPNSGGIDVIRFGQVMWPRRMVMVSTTFGVDLALLPASVN